MNDDITLEEYIAGGGKLSSPVNASPRYRGELLRLMAVFVDSEMAGAAGFADCINMAPGLKERMIAARIVMEKFHHAERVLKLMEEFGANTERYVCHHPWARRHQRDSDLGLDRQPGDMRLNVFHYPINDWCDAVTMNHLMGLATVIQLSELKECSYQPLAVAMTDIVVTESKHSKLGTEGLNILINNGYDKPAIQASVDYWVPRVAATFGRLGSSRQEIYQRFALRKQDNEAQHANWRDQAVRSLEAMGLTLSI